MNLDDRAARPRWRTAAWSPLRTRSPPRPGVAILQAGGSAVDAAIAAAAVLSVVYPHMTSLGGDAFWLIHDARTGAVRSLEAAGRAAAAATLDWFAARGLGEIPVRGIVPATLTVPGAVDGWCEAHAAPRPAPARRPTWPRRSATRATASRSRRRLAEWIERSADVLAADPAAARIFLAGGPGPAVGRRLANPDLARTLERAAEGRAGFYEGETAREMARHAREHGGFYTERDFAAQRATWGDSIHATYRGVTIHETPPPSQGVSVLQIAPAARAAGRSARCRSWGRTTCTCSCRPSRSPSTTGTARRRSRVRRRCRSSACCRGPTPTSAGLSWTRRARCPGIASRRAAA